MALYAAAKSGFCSSTSRLNFRPFATSSYNFRSSGPPWGLPSASAWYEPIEKRPEGQHILEAARRGEFNQLLIYKLDRLGRDTRLILNAVAELEKHGVRVRSMTEEFDTATATGAA
jgi:Resolvase, N terminal domain